MRRNCWLSSSSEAAASSTASRAVVSNSRGGMSPSSRRGSRGQPCLAASPAIWLLLASYRVRSLATASYKEVVPDWLTQGRKNTALVEDVWARDGQAPARAQTLNSPARPRGGYTLPGVSGVTSEGQYIHRIAAIGMVLRHCGQSRVVTAPCFANRAVTLPTGSTIR